MNVYIGGVTCEDNKIQMPYLSGCLNFSWEINASIMKATALILIGRIIWLTLDIIILFINIKHLKRRIPYIILIGFVSLILRILFINSSDSMLVSSFVIDLIMAIDFIVENNLVSKKGSVVIAITKLIGDACAGIYYCRNGIFIFILSVLVFMINLFYLAMRLENSKA